MDNSQKVFLNRLLIVFVEFSGLSRSLGSPSAEEVPSTGRVLPAGDSALPLLGLRAAVRAVRQVPELRPRPAPRGPAPPPAGPAPRARRAAGARPPGPGPPEAPGPRPAEAPGPRPAGARGPAALLRERAACLTD